MDSADLKTAVQAARDFLDAAYGSDATAVRLEEVESTGASLDDRWRVTLSFLLPRIDGPVEPDVISRQFGVALGISSDLPRYPRHMKVFVVDERGNVQAMKNHKS